MSNISYPVRLRQPNSAPVTVEAARNDAAFERIMTGEPNMAIKFADLSYRLSESLAAGLQEHTRLAEPTHASLEVADQYLDRGRLIQQGGIELNYNLDTGEVIDYYIDFFSEDFTHDDFAMAYRNGSRSSIDMLTERYESLWKKIGSFNIKDEHKEFLRSKLGETFARTCVGAAFRDATDRRMWGLPFAFHRDFATAFSEAYNKDQNRVKAMQKAFTFLEKTWGVSMALYSVCV